MEAISQHSLNRAGEEAVRLWALASAQYPKSHQLIVELATVEMIETVSAFALNARRSLELLPLNMKFSLTQPRWQWSPTADGEMVHDLWDALNRVIHAQKLLVGFEELPAHLAVVDGGALVIPYIKAATDRKALSFIDPFALSHAFLYNVLPRLLSLSPGGKQH
ncbi:MAG: hypothetical protein Q8M07_18020 [Prosthecobacter sp.]|nr:hypothetical protein [Prosthecobacter sp.]